MTRIVLIHAYAPSMPPMAEAFRSGWPQAEVVNLLDEALYADVGPDGALADDIQGRIAALFAHARASRADAIVFTGSTFGPAVERARAGFDVPILKADEALCLEAAARGGRALVVCTAARAIPVIVRNLEEAAGGRPLEIATLCVQAAKSALEAGDEQRHDELIAAAVETAPPCETVILGQASMAGVRALLTSALAARTLTGPQATAARLRALLER